MKAINPSEPARATNRAIVIGELAEVDGTAILASRTLA